MTESWPDFKAKALQDHRQLGTAGAQQLLDAGRAWDLAPVLSMGGALLFPHTTISICGHQIAAVVHACLDCNVERVLVLGCLHALTPELEAARARVANGADPATEAAWGIQGPNLPGRDDWQREFSLDHFLFLWRHECRRRSIPGPELILCYPYLAGGAPQRLPNLQQLQAMACDVVVVGTMDPFHHGIGYGDPPESALSPAGGGLALARQRIQQGLSLLQAGDYWGYNQHCVSAKSDGRDVGQLLRLLTGRCRGEILDLVADDMSTAYRQPAPTWVAGALIALQPV